MTQKKQITGLGKGLGALLPSIEFSDKGFKFTDNEAPAERLIDIEISKIVYNPYQPRKDFDEQALKDLKNSIIEHGVIQPITVRRSVNGYELIAGERRLRATEAAGFTKIPAFIMDIVSDIQMLEIALIENVQRENLNPIEIASGYQRLIEECQLTQEEVAKKVGKDRSTVTNFLRLLRLPDIVQESLRKKEISMGHARTLLALSVTENIFHVWHEICESGLSVRATETLVKDVEIGKIRFGKDGRIFHSKHEKTTRKSEKKNVDPEIAAQLEENENQLRHIYGTQVRISPKSEYSGSIEFEFYTIDDFSRLIDLFTSVQG
jgi:ParB family transcriptional regulator, chromosome partitioning protein